jgi:hypothetical protein
MTLMSDLRKTVEKNKKKIDKFKEIIRNLKLQNSNSNSRLSVDSEIQKTLVNNQNEIKSLKENLEQFKNDLNKNNAYELQKMIGDLRAKVEKLP